MPDISHSQFVERTHDHLNGYIKFADQKASLLLTAHIAFLGLYATVIESNWLAEGVFFKVTTTLMLLFSLASAALAGWTVYPRTPETQQGLMLWNSINEKSIDQYKSEVRKLDDDKIVEELLDENYQLSNVAVAKYKSLRVALIFTAFTAVFAVISTTQIII